MNRWNAETTLPMQYSLQEWICELEIMDNQQEILHWWSLWRNLAMLLLFMSTTNLILTKLKGLYSGYSCLQWWQLFCCSQSFSFPKRNILLLPIKVYLWVISEYFIPCSRYSKVNNKVISHKVRNYVCIIWYFQIRLWSDKKIVKWTELRQVYYLITRQFQ